MFHDLVACFLVARKADILLEARILSRNNSEDFNPREGESKIERVNIQITSPLGVSQGGYEGSLNISHRDLLGEFAILSKSPNTKFYVYHSAIYPVNLPTRLLPLISYF